MAGEQDLMRVVDPNETLPRRCHATSKGTGEQCKQVPVPGATVCKYHGGGAPQVRKKAQLRLIELIDPAITTLAREMATADSSADRQRAANSILDRAGMGRTTPDGEVAREALIARLTAVIAQREALEARPDPQLITSEETDPDV